ncbi:MAG: hypothetical protein KAS88_00885 [Deltaproteobacteria bacterium]|nr:hypothetical protein [Deltaproteobacteria bacterium]
MKQRAHAWTALRALKLLDDSKKAPKLVELLSYYLSDAWDGAWLPDTLIVDMSYGHIFKMDSSSVALGTDISGNKRYVRTHKQLDKALKGKRLMLNYVKGEPTLDKPYMAHPKFGGHLPNRVIALSHSLGDMLKMSNYPMAFYAKEKKSKHYLKDLSKKSVKDLSLSPNFSARQIAMTFFLLSHYICDAHMPLHCDLRDRMLRKTVKRRIPAKLHPSIEKIWEKQFPEKIDLILHDYTKNSIDDVVAALPDDSMIMIDSVKKYSLGTSIPVISQDEWTEMVQVCRTSYAVSRKWIAKPYKSAEEFIEDVGSEEFVEVTNRIFHDAVQCVAAIWLKAWKRYIR